MARKYYTLVAKDTCGYWGIEFGDYNRETVEAELEEYREIGRRRKDLKIITTLDAKQKTINEAVAKLNAE